MTCILCDSWAHMPANPKTKHPEGPRPVIERDVETALLVGFMWGTVYNEMLPWKRADLCANHILAVAELAEKLGLVSKWSCRP